ncbi:enoyl-CoA hydratase/isomerase family protein [Candidatus Poriferisocius sp.]|uniref:enoyl-CoA hydratase/isomerase family protein n=1 Tax=Candidatus Poriferisocius sp. TaxID=3101276 RepID=UPI003B5A5812
MAAMSEQQFGPLHLRIDRRVGWVTIDHPPKHLVDGAFIGGLIGLLDAVEADDRAGVLVFESADPDFFLMHGDVEQILTMRPPDEEPTEPNVAAAAFDRCRTIGVATIGMINGVARGGGSEFLLSLDMRFAGPRTLLGQPEVAMGIIPGASGTQRLARLVGRSRALEIILSGNDVEAEEAAAIGYVNRVLPTDRLRAHTTQVARRIAASPPLSIARAKQAVDAALGPVTPGLLVETQGMAACAASGQHVPLMQRFLDAGGQSRDAERGAESMAHVIDRMLELGD